MDRMTTYIEIKEARFYAFHGVMEQERRVGGYFIVTLRVGYDWRRAAETDDVCDTLDYSRLFDIVSREMAVASNLLERVAGRIAQAIEKEFPAVSSIDLWVTKENPPMGADCNGAGVEGHWTK